MSHSQRSDRSPSSSVGAPGFKAEAGGASATAADRMRTAQPGDGPADLNDQARQGVAQAQEQVDKLVGMARGQATTQLASQKAKAADTLGSLATALHQASSQMRQQDDTVTAGYIDTAAGQIDRLAGILADQDIDELLEATGQFARRQPALFLAAAFALGFAGARFLKSSSTFGGRLRDADDGAFAGRASYETSRGYGKGATGDWRSRSAYATSLEGQ